MHHPDEQVNHFDEIILNIAKNFIPCEEKVFYPKDPPWLTKACKDFYNNYRRKYKRFVRRGCPQPEKAHIDDLKTEYSNLVQKEKDRYLQSLGSAVSDPRTGQKKYWTALKKLLNKKVSTIIPPILYNGNFITDIKEKCDTFNEYFKNQCTLVETTSTLPPLTRSTNLKLSNVDFSVDDITKHINKLNINKAHGHDGIPVRIIKLCGNSVSKPLYIILKNCISKGYFPKKWKKANVIPVYKKKERNLIQNFRPVSLLPICGKIFEKIIFDSLYPYIFGNNFINDLQSGYRKGDSAVKQLISITHEIYKAFDDSKEIRAVFLDISRAFDKVWAAGLIFKLKRIGIEGDMINILISFLADRKQRVALDGVCSDWADISAGVPQGSILGPILFLVYINDLIEVVSSDIRIFADDTFIFRIVDQYSTEVLNADLKNISIWAHQWKMLFNPDMTKQAVEIVFSRKRKKSHLEPLVFNGIPVKKVDETKHLGLILDNKLNFESHLEEKLAKARSGLGVMIQLKKWVSHMVLETIYKLYVRPHLDYCDIVYHTATIGTSIFYLENSNSILKKVESIQYEAARIVTGAWKGTSMKKLYDNLGWESLSDRRIMRKLYIFFETLDNKFPRYLYNTLKEKEYTPNSRLFNKKLLKTIPCSKPYKLSFFPSTILDWNKLEAGIKEAKTKHIFKNKLLNKIRPKRSPYFGLQNNDKVRYITMLRLGLSPLRAHKFKYGFQDTSDPFCLVCESTEDTEHYLLHCKSYSLSRTSLMYRVSEIIQTDISTLPKRTMVSILLFGMEGMTLEENCCILNYVVDFIEKNKRLDTF